MCYLPATGIHLTGVTKRAWLSVSQDDWGHPAWCIWLFYLLGDISVIGQLNQPVGAFVGSWKPDAPTAAGAGVGPGLRFFGSETGPIRSASSEGSPPVEKWDRPLDEGP